MKHQNRGFCQTYFYIHFLVISYQGFKVLRQSNFFFKNQNLAWELPEPYMSISGVGSTYKLTRKDKPFHLGCRNAQEPKICSVQADIGLWNMQEWRSFVLIRNVLLCQTMQCLVILYLQRIGHRCGFQHVL